MTRPTVDEYFLKMAELVATRSTCLRRSVGCVLVNDRNHVLSTGYNGVHAGAYHCNQYDQFEELGYPHACKGAFAETGKQLESCEAIHAEQNALLQCKDVHTIATAYVTVTPCITCMKLLLNTSCRLIVALDVYAHPEAVTLWLRDGRALKLT